MEVVGGAIINKVFAKSGEKKSKSNSQLILPDKINTGTSSYNTKSGEFDIDPTIRAGQEEFLTAGKGLKSSINKGFDKYNTGLGDLRDRSSDLRSSYEGNQSDYREAMLNPLREKIALREGELDRNLDRTNVRGSFAQQSRDNLAIESGRALGDAEAQIENQRINKLGDFLGMDADILKSGLASDTGRAEMLFKLEQSLSGISTERFNQEMALLGLPGTLASGGAAKASMIANAQGVNAEADSKLVGSLLDAARGDRSGDPGGAPNRGDGVTGGGR
ncbi:MAG: hypothetical protein GY941_15805 [Planctomycetes bacterium]|nr:hypothetical protein [Planctomycetota bacterium]